MRNGSREARNSGIDGARRGTSLPSSFTLSSTVQPVPGPFENGFLGGCCLFWAEGVTVKKPIRKAARITVAGVLTPMGLIMSLKMLAALGTQPPSRAGFETRAHGVTRPANASQVESA